ncbi:MAG: hypothetical protein GAK28_01984 [Luteibacter sp.]|uniref:hypothetical protein n=1 Tax=Luteibacter sp. TaxID=1886636 RepID=UPI00138335D0|nr:hypothetical protein [Luteibacter sp.]KAF1007345.1 MAG: hypothetical protein GAK28_01984 [Luteibacter sp.]
MGVLVETIGFDQIFYIPSSFYLDRQAPGGSRLPKLELPLDRLSITQLRNDLDGKLVGDIADYYDQEPGDIIRIFAQPLGGGASIPILEVKVSSRDQHTRPEFLEEHLEKLDPAGTYELYYDVTDLAGNRSIELPPTQLTVWIKDAPVDMPPPVFPGKEAFDDEILRDPQIRPFMDVEIPDFPGAAAGQSVVLVMRGIALDSTISVNVGTLVPGDIGNDPILVTKVPYGVVATHLLPIFGPSWNMTAWYEVEVGSLPRPQSDAETATIVPGFLPDPSPDPDPDPEPGKPENPNNAFQAPLLKGLSATDDIITVGDNDKPATVTAYWEDVEGRPALQVGDQIQAVLNGENYGDPVDVDDEDEDVEIPIDVANPGLPDTPLEGGYWLYCEITRDVEGEDITIDTPAKYVVFQSTGDLPGGGTLAKSYFIAGERKGPGRYAINGSDVVQDNGTDVRCYVDDTKVVRGMTVNWRFEGFLQGGAPAPGAALAGSFVIDDGDLRPRPDDPRDPARNRAFRDIHIPRANLEAIGGRGSATFEYWITVAEGESRSDKDTIVADIRIPDADA